MTVPVGPSRNELLRRLRGAFAEECLPITLGDEEPRAVIQLEDERWTLRPLRLDETRLCEVREAVEVWVPQLSRQCMAQGEPLIAAPTKDAFVAALELAPWEYGPED